MTNFYPLDKYIPWTPESVFDNDYFCIDRLTEEAIKNRSLVKWGTMKHEVLESKMPQKPYYLTPTEQSVMKKALYKSARLLNRSET